MNKKNGEKIDEFFFLSLIHLRFALYCTMNMKIGTEKKKKNNKIRIVQVFELGGGVFSV